MDYYILKNGTQRDGKYIPPGGIVKYNKNEYKDALVLDGLTTGVAYKTEADAKNAQRQGKQAKGTS